MLEDHDQDVLPRCRRLGHEIEFGYCRRENRGRPCRLILDCWWERFDVRSFLQAQLPEETMAQVEGAREVPPPAKVLSLVEIVQQAKERLAAETSENPGTSEGLDRKH
jgi:hypothetical protein